MYICTKCNAVVDGPKCQQGHKAQARVEGTPPARDFAFGAVVGVVLGLVVFWASAPLLRTMLSSSGPGASGIAIVAVLIMFGISGWFLVEGIGLKGKLEPACRLAPGSFGMAAGFALASVIAVTLAK